MVDFGTVLFTAGIGLVEKLLFKWISEGKSAVKISSVERQITDEAAIEAERLRIRADDLEQASQKALQEIVTRSPQLSFARSGLRPNLRLDFDPKDPNSSKNLLLSLRQRIDELASQAQQAVPQHATNLPPGATLVPPDHHSGSDTNRPPGGLAVPRQGSEARRMLDDLKARVERIETDRE